MEEMNNKLKIFISYSHDDEKPFIEEFRKHLAPLKDKGLVEEWYDRMILPGENYQSKIDYNLEDADIICLFISANFLDSPSCKKEKKKAIELQNKKGTQVIPIILSPCGWEDDEDISKYKLLALPTDGKPISTFPDRDEAWSDVYEGLKEFIEEEMKIRGLKITEEFENFLRNAEMLTEVKEMVLDDIFVHPELDKYDYLKEPEEKVNTEELLENILDYPKIVIAGESQSGKTTLCKMIFKELRRMNFIPVYISDGKNRYRGKIENKIIDSLRKQYNTKNMDINKIEKERIIPILDDFHLAKNKEKHLNDLSNYPRCVLIVDDIFCLNVKNEKLIGDFIYFRIRELKPSLRYELVKKWVSLKDMEIVDYYSEIDSYSEIDRKIELINSILGKIIGRGIMPAYPFFILSAVVTYETSAMPLDQEITSQGYCYQAFIYFYLRKQGVRNDEIDIYVNFLTELAFYIYKQRKYSLSPEDFSSFMKIYKEKYILPINQEILLQKLSLIISRDSFNNYSFSYPYLYYFFAAKYLAEHIDEDEIMREIEKLMQNLHIEEKAYIAVFLAHHSKSPKILDEIVHNAVGLFGEYEPVTLFKEEVKFFDEQADAIIKAALPVDTTPERERAKRLSIEDEIEEAKEEIEEEEPDEDDHLMKELRRAIKTGEVIGCIIKNRVGSLEKGKAVDIFKEGMNIHLRILSSFFEIIKSKDAQQDLIDLISKILRKIIAEEEEKGKEVGDEEIRRRARIIFWNFSFLLVYGIIYKIVHSLGSDKLTEIVGMIDSRNRTPASFLIKHGILMWYNKNLQIDELAKKIKEKDFSEIAQNILKFMIVNYTSQHSISYRDRQQIESKLGIPRRKLPIR
ncbi:TIR domain protein [Candidatus Methanoperedenaceae archaeon GB50]|nr:TIR domain protein [Candidatus Methanoperedenaceae archaeon GB50]CAD7779246.1 MAG: TIR domain protein [Candidatus Methanoperedenaceae archaeon GB50]